MKIYKSAITLAIAAWMCLSLNTATAGALQRYVNDPTGSQVTVEGDSTLHGWDAASTTFSLIVETPSWTDQDWAPGQAWEGTVAFTLPAKELKSGRRGLDRQMHASLLADDHPKITFALAEATVQEIKEDAIVLSMAGELTVAGVPQTKEFAVVVDRDEAGKVRLSGSQQMKMTGFEIDPPRAMLGAMRAADEVTVSFTFLLIQE